MAQLIPTAARLSLLLQCLKWSENRPRVIQSRLGPSPTPLLTNKSLLVSQVDKVLLVKLTQTTADSATNATTFSGNYESISLARMIVIQYSEITRLSIAITAGLTRVIDVDNNTEATYGP